MNRGSILLTIATALWLGSRSPANSQTYQFTTIAGAVGQSGSADGTNSQARFNSPSNLAVDRSGNIFVSDLQNHSLRKLTPVGTNYVVTTIAGSPGQRGSADGTNSDARFNLPNGLALDPGGVLYVADHYNSAIRQVTPVGTNWVVTTIAGLALVPGSADGLGADARFWSPTGIALDSQTNLFVVDTANYTIRELQRDGTNWLVSTIAGTPSYYGFVDGLNQDAEFNFPYGITIDKAGDLYITDAGNDAIRSLTRDGTNWAVTTLTGFSGNIGTNDGPSSSARFNFPNGIAQEGTNSFLVADQSNNQIRRVAYQEGDWITTTLAGAGPNPYGQGSTDGLGLQARFFRPWDIGLDSNGNLYITDQRNHTIRKGILISFPAPSLQISLLAGQAIISWPAWAANFQLETAATLPAVSWIPWTNSVRTLGDTFQVTADLNGVAFYRLHAR